MPFYFAVEPGLVPGHRVDGHILDLAPTVLARLWAGMASPLVPDPLWAEIEPLLPPAPAEGRPPASRVARLHREHTRVDAQLGHGLEPLGLVVVAEEELVVRRRHQPAVLLDLGVVADEDGAVVIPAALLDEVVTAAPEQERLEAWIMGEIEKGISLPGLYPPNAETRARYEATIRDT